MADLFLSACPALKGRIGSRMETPRLPWGSLQSGRPGWDHSRVLAAGGQQGAWPPKTEGVGAPSAARPAPSAGRAGQAWGGLGWFRLQLGAREIPSALQTTGGWTAIVENTELPQPLIRDPRNLPEREVAGCGQTFLALVFRLRGIEEPSLSAVEQGSAWLFCLQTSSFWEGRGLSLGGLHTATPRP